MNQKFKTSALLLILFFCIAMVSAVNSNAYPVNVSETKDSINLGLSVEYYEDKSSTLTLNDILKLDNDNKFRTTSKLPLNFGYSESTYWISFSVLGEVDSSSGWVLDIPYAPLDYIKLYVPNVKGEYQEYTSGDKVSFKRREIDYKNSVFVLGNKLLPYQQYYLKFSSNGALNLPLFLWTGAGFIEHVNRVQTGIGIYFGIMLALLLYNLFLYVSIRDKDFLLCAFITISYSLVQGAYNGMAAQFLWPNFIWWANNSLVFFAILLFLSIVIFTNSFLKLKEYSPFSNKVMKFFIGYYLIMYILFFIIGYRVASLAIAFAAIVMLIFVFAAVLIVYARGYKPARLLLLAWTFFLFGLILLLLKLLGFLPHVFITEYSVQIGFTLNATLLSFALADKINLLRRDKEEAQQSALDHLKQSEQMKTEFLEETGKLVEERTKELEEANTRLVQLASVDVLTGLFNRRVFNETIDREFNRSKRQGQEIAVIMIDIDYFKNYNDCYGHIEGDNCLAELAGIFSGAISRATDTVARYGGEEFAIILSDTKLDGAVKIAEEIRETVVAACLPHKMSPLGYVTVSCGVTSTVPGMKDRLEDFLNKADKALYKSKKDGRNLVSVSSY